MPTKSTVREKLGSAVQTVKDYGPVAKGVAKTFFLGRSKDEEENTDYSPGPVPKQKTPEPPKDWYKDSDKHLPSYERGTDYVPETGPAILHKGEKVIPVADNPISKVASALGSAGSKIVSPADDQTRGLAAKQGQIDEYTNSLTKPASEPRPRPSPVMGVDKLRPGSKYGDRGQEKRIDVKNMIKPLGVPSYEDGVDSVPNDGLAMLHKGEQVIPAKKNPDSGKAEKRVSGAMGGKKSPKLSAKKGSKKQVHKITVHKSANGGVVLEHHLEDSKSEMHHHPNFDSAAASMKDNFEPPAQEPAPSEANSQMASPSSFEDGGTVEKSGMAMVHAGETVIPADAAKKPVQNPDIAIGGGRVGTQQKKMAPKPKLTPEIRQKQKQYEDEDYVAPDYPDRNRYAGKA